MNLLSHPFRISPNGQIASVDQESDQCTAEQIAMLLLTKRGERDLVPGFGLNDVTLSMLDINEVSLAISVYYPGPTIQDIKSRWVTDGLLTIEVEF